MSVCHRVVLRAWGVLRNVEICHMTLGQDEASERARQVRQSDDWEDLCTALGSAERAEMALDLVASGTPLSSAAIGSRLVIR